MKISFEKNILAQHEPLEILDKHVKIGCDFFISLFEEFKDAGYSNLRISHFNAIGLYRKNKPTCYISNETFDHFGNLLIKKRYLTFKKGIVYFNCDKIIEFLMKERERNERN